jgi:hypothetical protein
MCPDAAYYIILLCLIPDDFTRQGKSAATQCVNLPMHPVNNLSDNVPYFINLLCPTPDNFTRSNARLFYSSGGECYHSMG